MNKIILIIFLLPSVILGCDHRETQVDKSDLLASDFRLFQATKAWNLAKYVEDEDIEEISKEILSNKISADYQEPIFGNTLLMLSIINDKYASARKILELGANPNIRNRYRGTSAVIEAVKKLDPKYLELILIYKGDPNAKENISVKNDPAKTTALNSCILSNNQDLKKIGLLLKAGADVNYQEKHYTPSPLSLAFLLDRMDVVFLLLKHGALYKGSIYQMSDGEEITILRALRKCTYDLNTKEYIDKKNIIQFLNERGLKYANEPIPNEILEKIKFTYPNGWQAYSNKY